VLAGGEVHAASFDCKKAATPVETRICNDPDLNSYDSQIQAAYQGALDRSLHAEQVTALQRAWLKTRDSCADINCMQLAYKRQIAALSKISDEPAICSGGTTPEVNACGAEYSKRADKELDRYVAAARKRLTEEGEDQFGQAAKAALPAFDKAQAAWIAYRKAECEAYYTWWSDGTIRGAMYNGCYLSVTKARTRAIWQTWLGFEDDTPPMLPEPAK